MSGYTSIQPGPFEPTQAQKKGWLAPTFTILQLDAKTSRN
jgi:hypothetical protein